MERRITYTSDFALKLRFRKDNGEVIGIPQQEFRIIAKTGGRETYAAGRTGDALVNIHADEESAPVMTFDAHLLQPGEVWLTFIAEIADNRFPDRRRHIERLSRTGVVLVPGQGDSVPDMAEAVITVPDDIDSDNDKPGTPGDKPSDTPGNPDTPPSGGGGYEPATDEEVEEILKDLLQ